MALAACSSSTAAGPDCSHSDAKSCNACYAKAYPAGVAPYNAVATCIACDACYTTCQSATNASFCTGAPATTDPCDTGEPSTASCQACEKCSTKTGSGSCMNELDMCLNNSDCKALLGATCPSM